MKKVLFITATLLATACASTADLEKLQAENAILHTKVNAAATDADQAKVFATLAAEKASAAETAASKSLKVCQELSGKLDRLFKKAQYK
jgi:murein lipoprotein